MSDQEMDARLVEAGQRWREANASPAAVDFDAVRPAATDGDEIALDYPQPPAGRRHRVWPWLAAVAAVAVLVVGITAIVRPSGADHRGAADSFAAPYGAWRLVSYTTEENTGETTAPQSVQEVAYLELLAGSDAKGDDAHVVADLGCSTISGRVNVVHSAHADGGGLTFGKLATTDLFCPPGTSARARMDAALQAVFVPRAGDSPHQALWSYDGTHLVLTAPTVALTYVASPGPDRAGAVHPALLGTSWTLANFTPDGGKAISAVRAADIAFGDDGSVEGDDGCNHFSSTNAAPATTVSGTAGGGNGDATGTVVFGEIAMTAIGCVDVNLMWQLDLFDKIVMSPEPAAWTIYGSGKLALSREGAGTLVFVKADLDPGFNGQSQTGTASPTTSNTDPHLLTGVQWRLDTITHGNSGAAIDWVENAAPRLTFSAGGTVEGYDGCDPVNGTYTVDGGTMTLSVTVTNTTACSDSFAAQIAAVLLSHQVTWKVEKNDLSLSSGTTTLGFGAASS